MRSGYSVCDASYCVLGTVSVSALILLSSFVLLHGSSTSNKNPENVSVGPKKLSKHAQFLTFYLFAYQQ